jgi:hypothetical protein
MASGGGKPPPAPDPQQIIALQSQYNRYNQNGPFGSTTWTKDPNGHETQNITPSARMQGSIDRAFDAAETPLQREYIPQGMDQLASAILGRVGARYGLGSANPNNPMLGFGSTMGGAPTHGVGGQFNTNLKPQQQSAPAPNFGAMQIHGGQQIPQQATMGG